MATELSLIGPERDSGHEGPGRVGIRTSLSRTVIPRGEHPCLLHPCSRQQLLSLASVERLLNKRLTREQDCKDLSYFDFAKATLSIICRERNNQQLLMFSREIVNRLVRPSRQDCESPVYKNQEGAQSTCRVTHLTPPKPLEGSAS